MKRTAKLFASLVCAISALASAVSPAWAATTITVTADKASGTYDAPFSVTLTASDPSAKIWYVFDPKAPPGDALPYTKPLFIDHSTPLLYFAYVDKENESKVERRDYVVLPTTLKIQDGVEIEHGATVVTLTLQNYGSAAVPLSGWTLRTDLENRSFPAGSVSVPANSVANFTLPYSDGAVTLSSPDGDIRSTAGVTRKPEVAPAADPKPVASIKPSKTVAVAEKPTVAKIPTETGNLSSANTHKPPVTDVPANAQTDVSKPANASELPTTPDEVLKASADSPSVDSPKSEGFIPSTAIKASASESGTPSATGKTSVFLVL